MYCNYIILGVLILIPFCLEICCFSNKENKEASNDFSNEEKKKVQKKFIFSPEKRGERLFLYFIYLFPLIISAIRPGESGFNIFDSIKSNMSFYATALTITFAVYSFLKTQNATEEERIEREKQREKERTERENQREEERRERENKDFILREKELEAKMDYYRPLLVVGNHEIKLVMKEPHFYLENIILYKYDRGIYRLEVLLNNALTTGFKKSEEVISNINNIQEPLCIIAQTQKGEHVLTFIERVAGIYYKDYIYIKNYKYLKLENIDLEPYTLKVIEQIWGSYNTLRKHSLSSYIEDLFKSTIHITMLLHPYFAHYHRDSLNSISLQKFFVYIFTEINENYLTPQKNNTTLYSILSKYIEYICDKVKSIEFHSEIIQSPSHSDSEKVREYEELKSKIVTEYHKITHMNGDELQTHLFNCNHNGIYLLNIETFLNITNDYLKSNKNIEQETLKVILNILISLFKLVTFKNVALTDLNKLKGFIANLFYY